MELEPRSSRARGAHKFRTSSHSRPRRRRKMSADAVYMAKLAEQAERYDEMVRALPVGARIALQCRVTAPRSPALHAHALHISPIWRPHAAGARAERRWST